MPTPTLAFGCEIEMFANDDYETEDYVEQALEIFGSNQLCEHTQLCCYHCRCELCDYTRSGALLAAQEDSTVGAEFITRILRTRSNRDLLDMRRLRRAYEDVQRSTGFHPNGNIACGNHVHVGWPDGSTGTDQARVGSLLNGLFSAELPLWESEIATGGARRVRDYNSRPSVRDSYGDWYGSWVSRDSDTIELRLWNTPRDPERLLVHPALSVTLVHWAFQTIEDEDGRADFSNARSTYQWAQDRAAGSRKRIARLVKEIWPDAESAELAAELISA